MTIREAIERLSLLRYVDIAGANEAVKMAISALRAQETPLDRNRWEGCEWCNKYGLVVAAFDGWSYCNRCGKPLTKDAWAELERRINGGTTD